MYHSTHKYPRVCGGVLETVYKAVVRGQGGGGDLGELVVVKEKLEPVALMAFVMEGAKVRIAFFEIMGEILVKGV